MFGVIITYLRTLSLCRYFSYILRNTNKGGKIILILFVISYSNYFSQNLVPNPSFDIWVNFDSGATGLLTGNVLFWNNPTYATPDVFNTCSTNLNSQPSNCCVFGFQPVFWGTGYVGCCFFHNLPNYKEYIQVKLDSPLVNQEHYCCSFYVNRANRSKYASNNIGMYFSDTPIHVTNSNTLPFTAQINDTSIVTDTVNWTEIYGEYVAHGGESYLIIGSFVPNALCDTLQIGVGGGYAYYYIDEVNVHCCTCDSTTSLHAGVGEVKEDEGIEIYPNPTSSNFTLSSTDKTETIKLYNVLGELLLTETPNNTQSTINISQFPKGIYFAEVNTLSPSGRVGEGLVVRKKVMKE